MVSVAAAMADTAEDMQDEGLAASFILSLGDNFYSDGVNSTTVVTCLPLLPCCCRCCRRRCCRHRRHRPSLILVQGPRTTALTQGELILHSSLRYVETGSALGQDVA
jgi:hypothetical protein